MFKLHDIVYLHFIKCRTYGQIWILLDKIKLLFQTHFQGWSYKNNEVYWDDLHDQKSGYTVFVVMNNNKNDNNDTA